MDTTGKIPAYVERYKAGRTLRVLDRNEDVAANREFLLSFCGLGMSVDARNAEHDDRERDHVPERAHEDLKIE